MAKEIYSYQRERKYHTVPEFLEAVLGYGQELDQQVKRKNESYPKTHYIESLDIWFRGQSDADWDLVPGVYRDGFAADDDHRIYKERLLAKDFRIEVTSILDSKKSNAEFYFLQQHYGMPTRLLDWTTNALAALFFAVVGSSGNRQCKCCDNTGCANAENKDCAVYMMNAYDTVEKSGKNVYKNKSFEGIGSGQNSVLSKVLKIIYRWKKPNFPDFIMPIRPDQFDSRIKLQSGCFTFHVPGHQNFTRHENTTLRQFIIDKNSKKDILHSLLLMGVNEFSIYGDAENLAKKLKRIYCSNETV